MTKYFVLTLSVILLFVACNKRPTPAAPDRESMLRTGKWKIAGGTFTKKLPYGNKDTTLQYLNFIPDCRKDDYIVFDSQKHAAVFSGALKCNASDADKIPFVWQLTNNGGNIDFYNGFNNLYSASATIIPVHFDTIYNDGSTLVLDTLVGVFDTPAHGPVVELDSIWEYRIDTLATPQISIYNAEITDFSQSSFMLHFTVISTYPDARNHRWALPVIRPDTMKYIVKYTNF
ncbi:MAG: hypothetical protein JWQ38_2267 [Flavipsychrobacter sp.]|nr:hypothetical protein [Flavipsychrobacter sp.]